jgi:hypothetical protein
MTAFEDRLKDAIVTRFEGMGEAWTTDESGDTLARAAAETVAREAASAVDAVVDRVVALWDQERGWIPGAAYAALAAALGVPEERLLAIRETRVRPGMSHDPEDTSVERGVWRHVIDMTECKQYPDSIDWSYTEESHLCSRHNRRMKMQRR